MARVTVVNDNPEFLALMGEVLEAERHVAFTIDGSDGGVVDRVGTSRPDLVILDLRMGSDGLAGWDLYQRVRGRPGAERLPMLLCSADLQALEEIRARIHSETAIGVLAKPFAIDELLAEVDRLLAASVDD
jgi:CheY-like chemotaxis protein